MSARFVLSIEPDGASAAEIRGALDPYGFRVETIPEAERALDWGRENLPVLIVLSVEPRKIGYAICNKIKRSPALREMPLILTSAEETEETFAQHRKLTNRADEYLRKPLDVGELLAAVDRLVGLGDPQVPIPSLPDGESFGEVALDGGGGGGAQGMEPELEISMDTTDAHSLEEPPTPGPDEAMPDADTRLIDQAPDQAQPAFAALEDGDSAAGRGDDLADLALEMDAGVPTRAFRAPELERETARIEPAGLTSPDDVRSEAQRQTLPTLDVEAEELVAAGEPLVARAGEQVGSEELRALERELGALRRENEELRSRQAAPQPVSKEKEFLNLREIINKKEKDILDLRDDVDARDRQVLDLKDKLREIERSRRDLEEKMLGFEKTFVAQNEKIAALSSDKERSVERERSLKARLDDAQTEIRKAYDEADALKKKLGSVEDRVRAELDKARAEGEERHAQELARLSEEHARAEAAAQAAQRAEIERLEEAHRTEMDSRGRQFADEQAGSDERHQAELARARRDHEKALAAREDQLALELAAERQAHEAARDEAENRHRAELAEATARSGEIESELDRARAEAAARERKVAEQEEQIVRAFQRLRGDERVAEKVKRALAVALAVLEEGGRAAAAREVSSRSSAEESPPTET